MFNKLIDWAVTNRLLVVIALTTLIVSAVFVIPKLNLDAFPDRWLSFGWDVNVVDGPPSDDIR